MESYSLKLLASFRGALLSIIICGGCFVDVSLHFSLAFYCHDNCSRSIMNLNEHPKKRTIINFAFIVHYDAIHYDSCIN